MALDQAGQVGRGAEDAGEQRCGGGRGDERGECGKLGLAAAALREIGKHASGALAIMDDGRGGDAGVEGGVGQVGSPSPIGLRCQRCREGWRYCKTHFATTGTKGTYENCWTGATLPQSWREVMHAYTMQP